MFEQFPSWNKKKGCLEPLAYVREVGEEVVVSADLPGVKREDIEVNLTEDRVEIRARMGRSYTFRSWGAVGRGVEFHSFMRVVPLPSRVNPDESRARFAGGILEIRAPKVMKRTRIEVE